MPKSVRKVRDAFAVYRLPGARALAKRRAGKPAAGVRGSDPTTLLGIQAREAATLARRLEEGFSFTALEALMQRTGLSQARLGELANIPPTTMARRRRAGRFSAEESDRLLRIARVVADSIQLFEGDETAARRWLDAPAGALGERAPFACLGSEHGARQVEDLIGRLEHGVFS